MPREARAVPPTKSHVGPGPVEGLRWPQMERPMLQSITDPEQLHPQRTIQFALHITKGDTGSEKARAGPGPNSNFSFRLKKTPPSFLC